MIQQFINVVTADISGLAVQLFFAFTISLMIFDKQKPPLLTGVLTGIALIVLGIGGSFNAPAVAAVSMINGGLWLVLGWQRFMQR
ncbi:MAG: hypothetical protein AB199_00650 [Parcubacteria bacterium C7867-004]|nr:MAG: hypothetical protein AB199_00650 [Parcubacteria bacterium C7867-004]